MKDRLVKTAVLDMVLKAMRSPYISAYGLNLFDKLANCTYRYPPEVMKNKNQGIRALANSLIFCFKSYFLRPSSAMIARYRSISVL